MLSISRTCLSALLLASAVIADAKTTVAVLELGSGGSVHQTTTPSEKTTTVAGVESFWSNLHNLRPRRYHQNQQPGMALVPDMFRKADSGIVIGLMGEGMDLSSMKAVSALLDVDASMATGHLEMLGNEAKNLMRKTKIMEDAEQFGSALKTSADKLLSEKGKKFQTVAMKLSGESGASSETVDQQISNTIESLRKEADSTNSRIVVHVVVESQEEHNYKGRYLEDRDGSGDEEDEGEGEEGENADGEDGSLYYGYGYYLDNGEYYTPYRTIFQIQYFNCVVWAAVGLVVLLWYTISITLNMPLMPDTLLFGESAKMFSN